MLLVTRIGPAAKRRIRLPTTAANRSPYRRDLLLQTGHARCWRVGGPAAQKELDII